MRRRVAAILLSAAALAAAAARAQTVTNENGYEVRRSQTVVPAPHGKVGRKTIDRENRTGNTEETDGNSSNFTMTLGGFLNKCPIPEGNPVRFVLLGQFEYSLVADTVDTDVVPTARQHYEKRVTAQVKVFVNDDLSITDGEVDGQFTANMDGVRTGPVSIRRQFRIGQLGEPTWDSLLDVALTSDLATAALLWSTEPAVLEAKRTLYQKNACTELEFEPASETRSVTPGETVEVLVKYRTREGKLPIPKGKWDAAAEGSGRVAEARGDVRPDGSFVVKYTAGSDPQEGHGAMVGASSAAGFAQELWKIRVGGEFELHLESNIVSRDPIQAAQSRAQGSVRLTSSTKPYKLRPDAKLYRLYDGTGAISFQTQSLRTDPCDPLIAGAGTSQLKVVDTWIVITPPQVQNGVQVAGKADIVLAYSLSMGSGETETATAYVDYQCVPGEVHPFPFWWSSYLSGREAEGEVNFLKDWQYVGQGDIVARKVLTGSCGGMCDEERSVFTLRKAPRR